MVKDCSTSAEALVSCYASRTTIPSPARLRDDTSSISDAVAPLLTYLHELAKICAITRKTHQSLDNGSAFHKINLTTCHVTQPKHDDHNFLLQF